MLTTHVERYLSIRRALGFELKSVERHLMSFARYAAARGDVHVRAPTAMDWALTGSSPGTRARRIRDVAGLARFLRAEDQLHEVPPMALFQVRASRPTPYIYTADEIARILQAAGRLKQSYPLRRAVITTLLGLIVATGLRISEALRLRRDDVLEGGVLRIRNTKFKKSRLVPLHPTAAEALNNYLKVRRRVATVDDHVFVSRARGRVRVATAEQTFRLLLKEAGIAPGRHRRPRIHDLRHTFATHALEVCPADPIHITKHFVALSTYLGHGECRYTYWYLEATPDLMEDMALRAEMLAGGGDR